MSVWCWFQDEEDLSPYALGAHTPTAHEAVYFLISVCFRVSTIRQVVWLSPSTLDQAGVGSAMGFPVRIEGTGTGINLFPQWCLVATGDRNREHIGHGSIWSLHEPAEGY